MYYILNGNGKRIDVDDMEFFSDCYSCGARIHHDDFWELVRESDFDPYGTAHLCPRCFRKRLTGK